MATPTKYTYSIATDFPSGLAADRLNRDIRASAAITIALDRIDTAGDVCDIWFRDVLPGAEETALDALVAAHSGVALPSEPLLDDAGHQLVVLHGGQTQIGIQAVQVLNLPDIAADLIKSFQVTAPALTTEILDIFIGDDLVGSQGKCYLAGGEYRCRTAAAEGSALHFSIVDRNNVLGLFGAYGMSRTKLTGLTAFAGGTIANVNVGEYAHGDTSGAKTKILSKGADFFEVQFHEAIFQDGETLTIKTAAGAATGVTCTLGTWDEGDVIEIITSVKDEWIEGYDIRNVQPGGSKEVPEGMYFRVKCYNAHATDALRVKVSLTVGRL